MDCSGSHPGVTKASGPLSMKCLDYNFLLWPSSMGLLMPEDWTLRVGFPVSLLSEEIQTVLLHSGATLGLGEPPADR